MILIEHNRLQDISFIETSIGLQKHCMVKMQKIVHTI